MTYYKYIIQINIPIQIKVAKDVPKTYITLLKITYVKTKVQTKQTKKSHYTNDIGLTNK